MLYPHRDLGWNQTGGEPLHYAFDPGEARLQLLFTTQEGGRRRRIEEVGREWDWEEGTAEDGKEGNAETYGPGCKWSTWRGNAVWPAEPHVLGSYSQEKNKLEKNLNEKLHDAYQYHFGPEP